MSGDAGSYTDDTQSDRRPVAQLCVGLSRISRSAWEGLSTGRHEKVTVRCLCGWLATLHGAPLTHCCSDRCFYCYDDGCHSATTTPVNVVNTNTTII